MCKDKLIQELIATIGQIEKYGHKKTPLSGAFYYFFLEAFFLAAFFFGAAFFLATFFFGAAFFFVAFFAMVSCF
ncbi:MAG: hypothetical protein JNK50_08050 [Bacteroidia bacterium]|nr:hypothetical protein [Bacteroidia bacterium]